MSVSLMPRVAARAAYGHVPSTLPPAGNVGVMENLTELADAHAPASAAGAATDISRMFPDGDDPVLALPLESGGEIYTAVVRFTATGADVSPPVDPDGIGPDDPAVDRAAAEWAAAVLSRR